MNLWSGCGKIDQQLPEHGHAFHEKDKTWHRLTRVHFVACMAHMIDVLQGPDTQMERDLAIWIWLASSRRSRHICRALEGKSL